VGNSVVALAVTTSVGSMRFVAGGEGGGAAVGTRVGVGTSVGVRVGAVVAVAVTAGAAVATAVGVAVAAGDATGVMLGRGDGVADAVPRGCSPMVKARVPTSKVNVRPSVETSVN
jgi:hypothetical protein